MPFTEKEAGIVDEDVEPAETGDRRRHRSSSLVTSRCRYMAASPGPAMACAVARPRSSNTSPIATFILVQRRRDKRAALRLMRKLGSRASHPGW